MRQLTTTLLLALLMAPAAIGQDWTETEDNNVAKVEAHLVAAQRELLLSQWEPASYSLKQAQWWLDRWAKAKLADHPKVKALAARKAALDKRLAAKDSSPGEGATWYVRREGGKKKKGGTTPEKPLKFLYKALAKAAPGDELRISGPVYGEAGAGHLELATPHVKLLGSWKPDFSGRDLTALGTVIRRKPDTDTSSIKSHLLKVEAAAGTVIDGLVFDSSGHNKYASGSMVEQRSPGWSLVHLSAHGRDVVIRNCVFLNARGTALDLIPAAGSKITIENCLFLNCLTTAVVCRGKGDVVVKRCTFAMLWAERSRPGCAVQLRSEGTLELHHNLICHADVGVRSLNNNLEITLENNVFAAISSCVLEYASGGTTQRARLKDLEDVDIEEDGNRELDVDLSLPPEALLRYLKSSHHRGLPDEALLAKLIARAEGRMPRLDAKAAPDKPKPKPKDEGELEDPFAEKEGEGDPFKKDPPEKKPEPKPDPEPDPDPEPGAARKQVPKGPWMAPLFVWAGAWPVPRAEGVDAGARPPR